MKKLMALLFAAGFLFSTVSVTFAGDTDEGYANPKSKIAKQVAKWQKILTYTPASETAGATYQSAVYDGCMMIVTTATYDTSNKIQSLSYVMYDKKDNEKFSGNFNEMLENTDTDAWVQAISKNTVLLVRVTGNWGNYTKYVLEIYKISKKGPKKVGKTLDLSSLSKYISRIIFAANKVIISFKITDENGNQTDNYVRVYTRSFSSYLQVPGGSHTDVLTSTMSHYYSPKYWVSDDTSYSEDYTKTYKNVIIYKK